MRITGLVLSICLFSTAFLFYSGCAPTAELAMNLSPNQTVTYKAITEVRKEYRFDQPSEGKVTEKNTRSRTELVYDQTVTGLDEKGNAVTDIKIKSIAYINETPEGIKADFDSSRESDSGKPLAKIVGQSYTIKISSAGEIVQVLDVGAARGAVKGGNLGKVASYLLSDEAITKRHSINALPEPGRGKMSIGNTWSCIEASPKGMLTPKNYEKIYTVKNIAESDSGTVATVEMSALPTSEKAKGDSAQAASGMGMFANMFDANDTFKGELVVNLDSGKVIKYYESLTSENTAAEMPRDAKQGDGPDVLRLAFVRFNSIEAAE